MSYTQLILILLVLIFSALMFLQNAKNQRSGNIVCLVITIILTFVAVFKPNTMADYRNYVDIVRYNEWGRYEPATFCINTISHLFHNPFPVFVFIYAILGVGIKIKAIKELSPLFWGSIIVYLSHYYILLDLIQIRAGVAAALSLFLIKYSTERNGKCFLLCYIAAVLFHYSAIFSIFIWFLSSSRGNKFLYFGIMLISYVIGTKYSFLGQTVSDYIMLHSDNYAFIDNNEEFLLQIKALAISIAFWLFSDKLKSKSPVSFVALKVYTIAICVSWLFSDMHVIAARLADLYLVSDVLLIPSIVLLFKDKLFPRLIILFYVIWTFSGSIVAQSLWNP